MELRWDAVTVDAVDADRLAAFWAALLGVEVRGRWEQYVGLHPTGDGRPRLVFQEVSTKAAGKPALHLDLHVPGQDELAAAVARVEGLGGRLVEAVEQGGQQWRVMADPEGNPFCLVSD